jgi:6-phosphogluconolactonase (cycloisomerase 2 family)
MARMIDGDAFHIGCYTAAGEGQGEGIMLARRDPATGTLAGPTVVAVTDSPSYLTHHPTLPVLYAAGELAEGRVGAWAVAPDGGLSALGSRPTGGASPCHLAVAPGGSHLATANYGGGSVAVHPLDFTGVPGERADLAVHHEHGPDPDRQEAAHAHQVLWSGDGELRVVDLGADSVYRYGVDGGRLRPGGRLLRTPPGTGPRHLAYGPDGWLYLAGELDASVTAYRVDAATGEAAERGRVPASADGGPAQPSEVAVDASGRFLYVANRGPDTIAVFALDDGLPRHVTEVSCGGHWPRHFVLHKGLLYVANERSHSVVTFEISSSTGAPTPIGAILEVPSPTCIAPAGVWSM